MFFLYSCSCSSDSLVPPSTSPSIYTNPTSMCRELLWVVIFLFHPGTMRPSSEHQPGARMAPSSHRFTSPFFLIYKLSVVFTGRLTTCSFSTPARVLLILSFLHPHHLLVPDLSDPPPSLSPHPPSLLLLSLPPSLISRLAC